MRYRCNMRTISSSEPCFDSGSLRFPHFGDCTHDGHPLSHGQSRISLAASVTSSSKRRKRLTRDPDAARDGRRR